MLSPQLITFLSVCQTGSFSKTAASMFLTPSAVLHQMQALEDQLGVTLFLRSNRGVRLTPQGEYLREQAEELMKKARMIQQSLTTIGKEERTIFIGTSIMEKCRLLYDLWMLYSDLGRNCEIQMLNISPTHQIPERTDLIESISSDIPWQREWEFFEVCRVPLGFAVPLRHPLADRSVIRLEDLKGQKFVTINDGSCEPIRSMIDLLRDAGAFCECRSSPELNPMLSLGFRNEPFLTPVCWKDIFVNSRILPFEKEFLLPYGIFYRSSLSPVAKKFVDFIIATYTTGNTCDIVPVLDI